MPITGDLYAFSDENLEKAPDQGGVYALYQNGQLIYIGRSKGGTTTISSRLKDHKAGRDGKCTQSADKYRHEPCSNPVSREKELLAQFQKANGKLPRCNEVMP